MSIHFTVLRLIFYKYSKYFSNLLTYQTKNDILIRRNSQGSHRNNKSKERACAWRATTMRRRVQPEGARGSEVFFFSFILFLKLNISRCSAVGSAPVSGLNHRSRRRIFEKSRKPLKTLTFSALPNVEKSSNLRSDHMFDHLQKNIVLHQSGCGSAW